MDDASDCPSISPSHMDTKSVHALQTNMYPQQMLSSMRYAFTQASERQGGWAPWMDDSGKVLWSRERIAVCRVIDCQYFEVLMSAVVACNIAIIIVQTDEEADCYPAYRDNLDACPSSNGKTLPWIQPVNLALLILYTIEAAARVFVARKAYVRNAWNMVDCFVVLSGWAALFGGSVFSTSFLLRFFRVARLARGLRIFIAVRELYMLLSGLVSSMRAIFWGSMMMFCMLLMWAIVVVEFAHPINASIEYPDCPRCSKGLRGVFNALVTLFQTIVAGDSWGQIHVPVIQESPAMFVLFACVLLTISLGLTNLILAVIVDRASDAREKDIRDRARQKHIEQIEQKSALMKICRQMDTDGGGTLSLEELLVAYDDHPEFRNLLRTIDIEKDELRAVFKVLDADGSGDVSYREFCDQLHQIRTKDTRIMLTFIKLAVTEVRELVEVQKTTLGPMAQEVRDIARKVMNAVDQAVDRNSSMERLSKRWSDAPDSFGFAAASVPPPTPSASAPLGTGSAPWPLPRAQVPVTPIAPPEPLDGERALSAEQLLADIDELSNLKNAIMRRLEEQVGALARQAVALASLGVQVECGGSPPEQLALGFGGAHISSLLREVDRRLDNSAAAVARSGEQIEWLSRSTFAGSRMYSLETSGIEAVLSDAQGEDEEVKAVAARGPYTFAQEAAGKISGISWAFGVPDKKPPPGIASRP